MRISAAIGLLALIHAPIGATNLSNCRAPHHAARSTCGVHCHIVVADQTSDCKRFGLGEQCRREVAERTQQDAEARIRDTALPKI